MPLQTVTVTTTTTTNPTTNAIADTTVSMLTNMHIEHHENQNLEKPGRPSDCSVSTASTGTRSTSNPGSSCCCIGNESRHLLDIPEIKAGADAAPTKVPEIVDTTADHSCDDDTAANTSADSEASVPSVSAEPKRVRFGEVEFRMYPMIMGDNPDCRQGPPVTISWNHCNSKAFSIDDFETARPARKSQEELQMTWVHRKRLLRSACGVTDKEMRECIVTIDKIRRQRQQTVKGQKFEAFNIFAESAGRRGRRLFSRKSSS